MKDDVKLLLVAGIGVAVLAWGVAYYSQIGSLVGTATTGYGNVVRALEPPTGMGSVGVGSANTAIPPEYMG